MTSALFVLPVPSEWQDVLISLGWLDVISLAHCWFFFSCVPRPSVQQKALLASKICARLAMNWPLCLSLQIKIIKANAVPLCAVAMGTGDCGCQQFAVCFGWKSKHGRRLRLDEGGVGGDAAWRGMAEVIQASWGTPSLCPSKQEAIVHWSSLRKGIRFSWPPLPCHQLYMLLLIPTRSACVTTRHMTPPPANLTTPRLAQFVYFGAWVKPLKTDTMGCSQETEINKAAVHSP